MSTGVVKFYNIQQGFGFIGQDGGQDVYASHNSLCGDGFRYLATGETVEFDIVEGPDGRPRAEKVRSVAGREKGIIKKFDHRKGFGFIRPNDPGQSDVFFHFSGLLGDGVKSAHEGEDVEFDVFEGDRGLQAVRIKRLDPRLPLFKFAWLGQGDDWAVDLAALAEPEDWTGRAPPPITAL